MDAETIMVKELKRIIEDLPEDAKLYFGNGDLTFQRLKKRGDDLYQLEFDQLYEIIE